MNAKKREWFMFKYGLTEYTTMCILLQAQKDYPLTIEQLQEGCEQLLRASFINKDLREHVRLLGELCNVGVKASTAGEQLRETFLKLNKPNR